VKHRKALLYAATLLLAVSSPVTAAEPQKDYATLLAQAKAGDPNVDMLALRRANAAQFGYSTPKWKERDETFAQIDTDPATALAAAEARLTINYLDLYAHVAASQALLALGRNKEAESHDNLISAVVRSVAGGHDGSNNENAWNAVSIDEEYTILVLGGFKFIRQSLVQRGGHTYDVMEAVDRQNGETVSFWFEIDSFFGKEFN
jgi:hypothetical protein